MRRTDEQDPCIIVEWSLRLVIEKVVFYIFAAVLLFAAVMVITARNPVHAALYLVLAFFNSAALWIIAGAEFLGIVLVLVYVGAVMVLFLFVVMMLDVKVAPVKEGFTRFLPAGLIVALAMALQMFLVIWTRGLEAIPMPEPRPEGYSHTRELGELLYTDYLYAFEIAAVLLLVAIIAAIMLTHRKRPSTKQQDPARQVQVKRGERVRLVKMQAEAKPAGSGTGKESS